MKIILALLALTLVAATAGDSPWIEETALGRGELLAAFAFENGDSLVVTIETAPYSGLPIFATIYHGEGIHDVQLSNSLPGHRAPDRVIITVCGGYVTIFGWWDFAGDDNVTMKYQHRLPVTMHRTYLPVICNDQAEWSPTAPRY